MEGRYQQFAGMIPVVDRRLLQPPHGQLVRDAELDSGTIRPLKEAVSVDALTDPFRRSLYKYEDATFEDGYRWLDWTGEAVNVIKNPVSGDQYNRIYYIDPADGAMKMRATIDGVNAEYTVGIPAPTTPSYTTKPRDPESWIRVWGYWYEDAAGLKNSEVFDNEGSGLYEVESATDSGTILFCPGTDATASGQTTTSRANNWFIDYADLGTIGSGVPSGTVLVPYFRAFTKKDQDNGRELSNRGYEIGTLIPEIFDKNGTTITDDAEDRSKNRGSSDFGINGVKCKAKFTFDNTSGPDENVFTMTYESEGAALTTAYVCTFVNKLGEESAPSDPTPDININPFQVVQLNTLDDGSAYAASDYVPLEKLRIYRVVTGETTATFKFVGEIDLVDIIGGYTWDDVVFDVETQETLPTTGSGLPIIGMAGLVHIAGGIMAAYKDRSVYFSEAYLPYSWPAAYELAFPYGVQALGTSGNTLAVLTDEYPFLVTGYDPSTLQQAKLAIPFPCINPYVIDFNGMIIYISSEGLIGLQGSQGINITEKYWSRTQWQDLQPETLHMVTHKERIYLFADLKSLEGNNRDAESTSGFDSYVIYPMNERKGVNAFSTYVEGAWVDLSDDSLYVIRGTQAYKMEGGTNYLLSRYITKETGYGEPTAPVNIRVEADHYPVTVTFLANNVPVSSIVLTDNKARKLPKMRREKYWAVQIDSRFVVRELALSMAMRMMIRI